MSLYNSFDRTQHLGELNTPLNTSVGYLTAAQRKARTVANLGLSGATIFTQTTPQTFNATGTLTAANLTGGILTSTTAAAVVATLPAVATMEAAFLALKGNAALSADDTVELSVIDSGPNTFTFATAAGWTDAGNAFTAVAAGTSARFVIRRTAANVFSIYKVS